MYFEVPELYVHDLLHLKKEWKLDVWTQQITSTAN